MQEVPLVWRMSRVPAGAHAGPAKARTSYTAFGDLLCDKAMSREYLEPSVFHLAAEAYDVGVFVIQWYPTRGRSATYYWHVRPASKWHIAVWFANGHFEAVQYGRQRVFATKHPFVRHLRRLCISHAAPALPEDDLDQHIMDGRLVADAAVSVARADATPPAARACTALADMEQAAVPPQLIPRSATDAAKLVWHTTEHITAPAGALRDVDERATTPAGVTTASSSSLSPPRRPPARSTSDSAKPVAAAPPPSPSSAPAKSKGKGVKQDRTTRHKKQADPSCSSSIPSLPFSLGPLQPRDIARHGELYSCVSFSNVPQWVGLNTLPWNAYRLASQKGDRDAQRQAVEDLLMLPQRVLTRTNRGGGNGRRLNATVRARCRDVGEELRRHYSCPIPRDKNVQLTVAAVPLVHQASTDQSSTADTDVSGDESDSNTEAGRAAAPDASESSDDADDDARSFNRASNPAADDLDSRAAKRAQHHVKQGHMRKAAQVLHSTTTMADLSLPEMQSAVEALHPPLPESSVIPSLPAGSPLIILEDDDVIRVLLRQSNNGSASGPSGWCGNMLSTLAESDLCRAGIIALLKDIVNGQLPAPSQQLLLLSRLVALDKPNGGGLRPIAMGELFYRLAALIMTRKVAAVAASQLSPHQYGVGVSSGAERVVHSLQHALADTTRRLSLLQVCLSSSRSRPSRQPDVIDRIAAASSMLIPTPCTAPRPASPSPPSSLPPPHRHRSDRPCVPLPVLPHPLAVRRPRPRPRRPHRWLPLGRTPASRAD